jgi:nucleotide-binding universal stress UspA family protein
MACSFKKILWATDFSAEAREALDYAEYFAKTFKAGLTVLHIVPDFSAAFYEASTALPVNVERTIAAMKKEAVGKLEALAKRKGVAFKKIVVEEGSVSRKIIEVSERERADLIVMGKKGLTAAEKILIGSVANQVLRHSLIPLLLTKKRRAKPRIKNILVPTDFSYREDLEREYAWTLAKAFGASLNLLHVLEIHDRLSQWELDGMFKALLSRLQKREKKEKERFPIKKEIIREVAGWIGIVDYAREKKADLIVMSSISRALGRFFLGSTTEKVISHSDVPVFAIPPREVRE